jgi:hypothetical protein
MALLEEKGIATRQGTHAPVIQGYYAEKYGLRPEQFPNAYIAAIVPFNTSPLREPAERPPAILLQRLGMNLPKNLPLDGKFWKMV